MQENWTVRSRHTESRSIDMHLIPRRIGDVSNPIGGVRNIIAGKGSY
jgi:hypothetical protein